MSRYMALPCYMLDCERVVVVSEHIGTTLPTNHSSVHVFLQRMNSEKELIKQRWA